MATSKGYILINRCIEDHWLWTDKPFTRGQAWIDLIMMANYADKDVFIKGKLVRVKRGQVLRSVSFLANRWGWNPKKVRVFLDLLKGHDMVTAQGSAQGTLITIENYETWQTLGHERGQRLGQGLGQARGHIQYKDMNLNTERVPRTPSFEEIKQYVEEKGYKIDPASFFDYYEETGWVKKNGQPIRDWKASVRTWVRREREFQKDGPDPIEPPKYKEFQPEEKIDAVEMPEEVRAAVNKLFKEV